MEFTCQNRLLHRVQIKTLSIHSRHEFILHRKKARIVNAFRLLRDIFAGPHCFTLPVWSRVSRRSFSWVPKMRRLASFITLLFVVCQVCTTQQAVAATSGQAGTVPGVHPLSGDVGLYARQQMAPRFDTCQQDFVQPVADFILRIFRSQTIKRGKQQVKIPDIYKTKFKGVGPIGFTVRFDATDGWLRDLSSLQRVGNVSISRYANNVVMEFGAGLKKMEFGYDKYDLKAGPFSAKGHISGEVLNSSITVKVSMDVGGETCSILVLDVKITIPGDVKMQATGMGVLNMFHSQIMASVSKKLEEGLPKAEASLSRSIQEVFQKLRCDDELGLI